MEFIVEYATLRKMSLLTQTNDKATTSPTSFGTTKRYQKFHGRKAKMLQRKKKEEPNLGFGDS